MPTILLCGKLFDAVSGGVKERMAITIDGNRITQVQPQSALPETPAENVVDLSDKFVLPGLIDAHVHLGMP